MKNGGPYTIKEKEQRRLQVYKMHFEEKNSALTIAKTLEVNRNTINEDIKYWCAQIDSSGDTDLISSLKRQVQRMELQRERLLDYLDEEKEVPSKIKLEKQISDIDYKLTRFYSKGIFAGKNKIFSAQLEFPEEKIKEFVLYLMSSYHNNSEIFRMSWNKIKFEIFRSTKSDEHYTLEMIQRMLELGMSVCDGKSSGYSHLEGPLYNIEKFAKLRGYIPDTTEKDIKEFQDSGLSDVDLDTFIPKEPYTPNTGLDFWKFYTPPKSLSDPAKWSKKIKIQNQKRSKQKK